MPSPPMDLQTAVSNFERAMEHCDNIITVHRGYGSGGGGRRYEEVSLDRAVIVLAIAAWQAAVQDITLGILDGAAPAGGPAIDRAQYEAAVGHARIGVGKFATPNAQNTRRLIQAAGFDPRALWTWNSSGGRGRPTMNWTPADADTRLDEWLQVRHAIAHGHLELPRVKALESIRSDGLATATLRLIDAEQCVAFIRRLVRLTVLGAAAHLGVTVTVGF